MTHEEKAKLVKTFQDRPRVFMEKVCKVQHWWDGMDQMLDALIKHDKVVVHSGHSLSKDYLGGRLPLWFLCSYYPARVVMTAPSDRQVKHIMWAELSQAYHEAGGKQVIGGELQSCLLNIEPNKHFALAFTTKETKGQTGKFQGLKARNVLIIISEAQAVDDSIFEQLEGISTAEHTKIILLGNPLSNTGFFARAIKDPKLGYFPVRLNCEDNPNFKQRKEIIPGLASYKWVKDMEAKYGRDSAMFQARVLGLVPNLSINTIIPYHLLEIAAGKQIVVDRSKSRRVVAIDPASFGDDECVIMVLEEGQVMETKITGKQRTTVTANDAFALCRKWDADGYIVDTVGEGRGVADTLVDTLGEPTEQVIEYKGSHDAAEDDLYYNKRVESHFFAAEMLEKGMCGIPVDDRLLMEELAETKYTHKRGLRICEDKEEVKDRLRRSPNRADAFIMGVWAMRTLKRKSVKRKGWIDRMREQQADLNPMAA